MMTSGGATRHPRARVARGDCTRALATARATSHTLLIILGAIFGVLAAIIAVPLLHSPGSAAPRTSVSLRDARSFPELPRAAACVYGEHGAFGKDLVIQPGKWLCSDAYAIGGGVTDYGRVGGSVTAMGGGVLVAGEVDGDVTAVGGNVRLFAGSFVAGNVQVWGGTIERDAGARVGGRVRAGIAVLPASPWRFLRVGIGAWLAVPLWALAGAVLAWVFPGRLARIAWVARRQFWSGLVVGAGIVIAGALSALVLFFTCLGIPLALFVLLSLWLAWVVGTVAIGFLLGAWALRVVLPRRRVVPLVATVLGVAVLAAAESVPCVGGALGAVVGCAGLGAVVLSLGQRRGASLARAG